MQTKKRISGRNSSRELASPRISRAQKKASDSVLVHEKKIAELITSSARKQRCTGPLLKRKGEPVQAMDLNSTNNSVHDETSDAPFYDRKSCSQRATHGMLGTIFSPTYHIPKISEEEREVDAKKCSDNSDVHYHDEQKLSVDANTANSSRNGNSEGAGLSSEVSAIYLAMKNSKLECIDEYSQDSISAEACLEEENYEEFDEFDPYLFMKNLPELSSIVPSFRSMLLPRQTRSCPPTSLVLDLDETLVHSLLEPCDDADFTFSVNFNLQEHTVYVRCRPYLRDFMERVSSLFEIIIFTASQSIYAEQLLNVLDPKRKIFRHRVFRESCVVVDGNYLKDLSVLGRDLSRVIIIDNSPQAFGFQVDNGIPIESWFDDRSDKELLLLLPFLESLVGVDDVRPVIAKKYNLRKKIAEASYSPPNLNRGDPFERQTLT